MARTRQSRNGVSFMPVFSGSSGKVSIQMKNHQRRESSPMRHVGDKPVEDCEHDKVVNRFSHSPRPLTSAPAAGEAVATIP